MNSVLERLAQCHRDAHARGVLSIWTVYDHPKDFPDSFVARRFEVARDGPVATGDYVQGELSVIRESFRRCGLTCLRRDASDEPQIVESWI